MTQQETAHDIAQYVHDALTQREVSARAWERQSNEWEARWRAVTAERDRARKWARAWKQLTRRAWHVWGTAVLDLLDEKATLQAELAAAHALIADLESRLGEAQQGLYVTEEQQQ